MIREKDRACLMRIFESFDIPFEVLAYGSRVNGTAHDGSDFDLVVRTFDGKPLDRFIFNTILEKIRHSNIPILVELRDWALLPVNFQENIQKTSIVFYSGRALYTDA